MRRRWIVLPPALLSLVLGLWGLRRGGSLWLDEAATDALARRELPELWGTLQHIDAVHGLYYLLMHALYGVFGDGVPVLRLPSVLATAMATAGVAMLGRTLVSPRAGLLAALAFPLLPAVQRYAQEGRSYALVCALVVWATYALVRAMAQGRRRGGVWVWYAALMLGACLLHEFAVLALVAHGLAVPGATLRAWASAAGCVVAGLVPLVVVSLRQSAQVAWIGGVSGSSYGGFAWVAGLGLVCAVLAPAALRRLALALLIVPTGLLMVVSLVKPLYVDRYVLYGLSGLALLLGAALDWALERGRLRVVAALAAAGAVAALVPTAVQLRTPQSRSDDVTAVAQAIRENAAPGDAVLYLPTRRRVWPPPEPGLRDVALDRDPVSSRTLYGTEASPARIESRIRASGRIVVVSQLGSAPLDAAEREREAAKRRVLRDAFGPCLTRRVASTQVTVYARPGRC
ncbi:glycosyltransferase family 39 protein [Streptomyces apocyni]|uniref:glycosyltransferase family 39 protein n=1 Tax=Streptomyces apocyni TaxID=2654677 RepID=UPI001E3BA31D|nr:glycosyltransferase family 39 protein [Streptomyces apocyni]